MEFFKQKKGSLTVEAAISLPIFMLVVLAIASFMRVVYVQDVIQHAINDSANELATYSYLYSASGLQNAHDQAKDNLTERSKTANEHITTAIDAYNSLSSKKEDIQSVADSALAGDTNSIDQAKELYAGVKDDADKFKSILDDIKNNPKGTAAGVKQEFISLAALMVNGAIEDLKGELASMVIKLFMRKHIALENVDENQRLLKLNVINGFDGLNFHETTLFKDKKTIDVIVSYDIEPLFLKSVIPNIHMKQRVVVKAWLNGDGSGGFNELGEEETTDGPWELSPGARGKEFEKQLGGNVVNDSSVPVDKYDTSTGEAIDIRTIDLTAPSYKKPSNYKSQVKSQINGLADYTGKVKLTDDPTKEYDIKSKKVVIVVPNGTITDAIKKVNDEMIEYAKSKGITLEIVEMGEKEPEAEESETDGAVTTATNTNTELPDKEDSEATKETVNTVNDSAKETTKTIPIEDYTEINNSAIHNGYSNKVMLGKYDGGGSTSYIQKAKDGGYTYFDLGEDWSTIKTKYNLSDDDMFKLFNEPFLDDGINAGKSFTFSHNPVGDTGALGMEYNYLIQNGYVYNASTMTMSPKK